MLNASCVSVAQKTDFQIQVGEIALKIAEFLIVTYGILDQEQIEMQASFQIARVR